MYLSKTLSAIPGLARFFRWRQAPEQTNQLAHGQIVLKVDRAKFKDPENVVFYEDPMSPGFGVYTNATIPAEAVVEMIPYDRVGEILTHYAESLVRLLLDEAEPGSARTFLAGLARTTQFLIFLAVRLRDGRTESTSVVGRCTPDGGLDISRPKFPFTLRDNIWGIELWESSMGEIIQMSIQEGDASRTIADFDEEEEEAVYKSRPDDVVSWTYRTNLEHYDRAYMAAYNGD